MLAPVRAPAAMISSGEAERGFSTCVATTVSAIGNRISAISPTALSRSTPNSIVMRRSGYRSESAERRAHAPAGLCATSITISGEVAVAGMTWNRPGHSVSRIPRSMSSAETRSRTVQLLGRRDRQCEIAQLMAANQRRIHGDLFPHHGQRVAIARACVGLPRRALGPRRNRWHILHRAHCRGIALHHRFADHVIRLRMLRKGYQQTVRRG